MNNDDVLREYYIKSCNGLKKEYFKDKDLWYNHIISLPEKLKATYTIVVFHLQIFNGGLHQYYLNRYGQFAYITLNFLDIIGAHRSTEILRKSIDLLNESNDNIDEFRKKVFNHELVKLIGFDEKLVESLNVLDDEYYHINYSTEENVMLLLFLYLQKDNS